MNEIESLYNVWHNDMHGDEASNVLHLQDWHKNALQLSPDIRGKRVLEVGCGAGDFAFKLEEMGGLVVAIDFSSEAIRIANRKKEERRSNVTFLQGDACDLSLKDGTFDIVFSCECIEHVPQPKLTVKEMARVLQRGDDLILSTENYSNALLLSWLQSILLRKPFNSGVKVQPIEHFFVFPMIYKMFRDGNLRIKQTCAHHHVFMILPRVHPHRFVVERFRNPILARMFKFLGRHWCFHAVKM